MSPFWLGDDVRCLSSLRTNNAKNNRLSDATHACRGVFPFASNKSDISIFDETVDNAVTSFVAVVVFVVVVALLQLLMLVLLLLVVFANNTFSFSVVCEKRNLLFG